MTALTKVIIIFLLTFVFLLVSIPSKIPIKFQFGTFNLDKEFTRPSLNINFGRIALNNDFDLKLGLDLAGGSHLVFEADVSGLGEGDKKQAIESLKEVIERRVNLFGVSEPSVQ